MDLIVMSRFKKPAFLKAFERVNEKDTTNLLVNSDDELFPDSNENEVFAGLGDKVEFDDEHVQEDKEQKQQIHQMQLQEHEQNAPKDHQKLNQSYHQQQQYPQHQKQQQQQVKKHQIQKKSLDTFGFEVSSSQPSLVNSKTDAWNDLSESNTSGHSDSAFTKNSKLSPLQLESDSKNVSRTNTKKDFDRLLLRKCSSERFDIRGHIKNNEKKENSEYSTNDDDKVNKIIDNYCPTDSTMTHSQRHLNTMPNSLNNTSHGELKTNTNLHGMSVMEEGEDEEEVHPVNQSVINTDTMDELSWKNRMMCNSNEKLSNNFTDINEKDTLSEGSADNLIIHGISSTNAEWDDDEDDDDDDEISRAPEMKVQIEASSSLTTTVGNIPELIHPNILKLRKNKAGMKTGITSSSTSLLLQSGVNNISRRIMSRLKKEDNKKHILRDCSASDLEATMVRVNCGDGTETFAQFSIGVRGDSIIDSLGVTTQKCSGTINEEKQDDDSSSSSASSSTDRNEQHKENGNIAVIAEEDETKANLGSHSRAEANTTTTSNRFHSKSKHRDLDDHHKSLSSTPSSSKRNKSPSKRSSCKDEQMTKADIDSDQTSKHSSTKLSMSNLENPESDTFAQDTNQTQTTSTTNQSWHSTQVLSSSEVSTLHPGRRSSLGMATNASEVDGITSVDNNQKKSSSLEVASRSNTTGRTRKIVRKGMQGKGRSDQASSTRQRSLRLSSSTYNSVKCKETDHTDQTTIQVHSEVKGSSDECHLSPQPKTLPKHNRIKTQDCEEVTWQRTSSNTPSTMTNSKKPTAELSEDKEPSSRSHSRKIQHGSSKEQRHRDVASSPKTPKCNRSVFQSISQQPSNDIVTSNNIVDDNNLNSKNSPSRRNKSQKPRQSVSSNYCGTISPQGLKKISDPNVELIDDIDTNTKRRLELTTEVGQSEGIRTNQHAVSRREVNATPLSAELKTDSITIRRIDNHRTPQSMINDDQTNARSNNGLNERITDRNHKSKSKKTSSGRTACMPDILQRYQSAPVHESSMVRPTLEKSSSDRMLLQKVGVNEIDKEGSDLSLCLIDETGDSLPCNKSPKSNRWVFSRYDESEKSNNSTVGNGYVPKFPSLDTRNKKIHEVSKIDNEETKDKPHDENHDDVSKQYSIDNCISNPSMKAPVSTSKETFNGDLQVASNKYNISADETLGSSSSMNEMDRMIYSGSKCFLQSGQIHKTDDEPCVDIDQEQLEEKTKETFFCSTMKTAIPDTDDQHTKKKKKIPSKMRVDTVSSPRSERDKLLLYDGNQKIPKSNRSDPSRISNSAKPTTPSCRRRKFHLSGNSKSNRNLPIANKDQSPKQILDEQQVQVKQSRDETNSISLSIFLKLDSSPLNDSNILQASDMLELLSSDEEKDYNKRGHERLIRNHGKSPNSKTNESHLSNKHLPLSDVPHERKIVQGDKPSAIGSTNVSDLNNLSAFKTPSTGRRRSIPLMQELEKGTYTSGDIEHEQHNSSSEDNIVTSSGYSNLESKNVHVPSNKCTEDKIASKHSSRSKSTQRHYRKSLRTQDDVEPPRMNNSSSCSTERQLSESLRSGSNSCNSIDIEPRYCSSSLDKNIKIKRSDKCNEIVSESESLSNLRELYDRASVELVSSQRRIQELMKEMLLLENEILKLQERLCRACPLTNRKST